MSDCNKKLQIFICDDDSDMSRVIADKLGEILKGYEMSADYHIYIDGSMCFNELHQYPCDLAFLDIKLPGMSGLELAKKINRDFRDTCVVFVTVDERMIYDADKCFMLKFVRKSHLDKELKIAMRKYFDLKAYQNITYKKNDEICTARIALTDLLFLECSGHNITLVTKENEYQITGVLKKMEQRLEPYGFIRIHKNYLVNKRYISFIESTHVILDTGHQLDLSKDKRAQLKKRIFR